MSDALCDRDLESSDAKIREGLNVTSGRASVRKQFLMGLAIGAMALGVQTSNALSVERIWRIAMLDGISRDLNTANLAAFFEEMKARGYRENQNLIVTYRSTDGRPERLPQLTEDLIKSKPDLFVVRGSPEVLAIKNANATLPVVMSAVVDPVGIGVAASLARPGGNITGLSSVSTELVGKRLAMLKAVIPRVSRVAVLGDLRNPAVLVQLNDAITAAKKLAIEIQPYSVTSAAEIVKSFDLLRKAKADAILLSVDGNMRSNRQIIIALAATHKLPAMYAATEFVDSGGLISYSPDYADLYRRAAIFVDKLLKGAKPSDLPIEQPMVFELAVNLRTAKMLGVVIPPEVSVQITKTVD